MNTTIKTFNCNEEQNNDWEALNHDDLVYYCRKNYSYNMKVYEEEEDNTLRWILEANKKELVTYLSIVIGEVEVKRLKTKTNIQFFLINKINKNQSLCDAKERIITPPTQELKRKIDSENARRKER